MDDSKPLYEPEKDEGVADPDMIPLRDRKLITQPYDLVVQTLIDQIENGTIYLRPISERPSFQRRYVWSNKLASRLIESVLLNVPIPPCYLSQNEDYELDVIDGQQRLYSIYRFMDNQVALSGLEILSELNGKRFHEMTPSFQRKLKTHILRCVLITNESHPEIRFDVFERLNTNTVPLNAQELRNCVYRGALNNLLKDVVVYDAWLQILGKKQPDTRMRDEELALRFFAFATYGVASYRTPQKHWLNDAAEKGAKFPADTIESMHKLWKDAITTTLELFAPNEAFRRLPVGRTRAINRALFDLVMLFAKELEPTSARQIRNEFRKRYVELLANEEFTDLISRAVDHKKRTLRRFELWAETFSSLVP